VGKGDRIKRNTLMRNVKQGVIGIEIVDLESKLMAIKASWMKRLHNTNSITYEALTRMLKNKNLTIFDIVKSNEIVLQTPFFRYLNIPDFYGEILESYTKKKKVKKKKP
jgi:hypothetical protein